MTTATQEPESTRDADAGGIGSPALLGSLDLKELYTATLALFGIGSHDELGPALHACCISGDTEKMQRFAEMVGDLSTDWLQRIYQYYCADRKEKKQDYTPQSLAQFMARLCGAGDVVIDLCAGSGALTIQHSLMSRGGKFILHELDEKVIPFLLFNLALRNIESVVHHANVLSGAVFASYQISKGERFGRVEAMP